ncbi:MAG: T9SS type A sorting domain-containing protein, partial [Balneolia bacterium]|nr:T9SS type A sorting domain-containing protein [Balneolia bacterium]
VQAELGNFDITLNDLVYVRGDFNEFSLDNPMTLTGDGVFEAEIEISGPVGSEREYKFFIEAGDERELPNGGWELFIENPDDNRVFTLGEPDVNQILPLVFFNDDEGAAEPEFVTVWPGDTNNDGVVNEEDVLPLAIYWNQAGPARENASVEWTGQQAEVWNPVAATFADTDGSGLINQTDLLAIGLNFGEMHGEQVFNADPVNSATISSLNTGDRAVITISAPQTTALQGLSFAFETEGVADNLFTIAELQMAEWAQSWNESGSLIEFNRTEGARLSGARAHKGLTNPEAAGELLTFVVEATQNWSNEAQLNVKRMSYIDAVGEAISFEEVLIEVDIETGTSTGGTELPRETALNQNYPNPFNPTTNIAFDLSENSVVTIEVVNILGQRVALLANRQEMSAGSHVQTFDASRLTSGVYLLRMTAGSQTFTRKMMLVK